MKFSVSRMISIAVIIMLALTGCSYEEPTGTLNVDADSSFRTILPDKDSLVCTDYILKGISGAESLTHEFKGTSTTVSNLKPGVWQMLVEGYSSEGILIGRSETQDVTIVPGDGNRASFSIDYLKEGQGTLDAVIKVPVAAGIKTVRIAIGQGDAIQEYNISNFTDENSNVVFSERIGLEAGNYPVMITLIDESRVQIGFTLIERLIIHPNLVSPYSVTIPEVFFPVKAPLITSDASSDVLTAGNLISITTSTEGATIRYTADGTDPKKNGTVYTEPFSIDKNSEIRAYASKTGFSDSSVTVKEFSVIASSPVFTPVPGTEPFETAQTVTISASTKGAEIRYTTDGSDPKNGTLYTAPVSIDKNTVLKAVASSRDHVDSPIVESSYKIRTAVPSFGTLSFHNGGKLEMTAPYPDSTITYRIGEGEWLPYSKPVDITESGKVSAFASRPGYENSRTVIKDVTVTWDQLSNPVFYDADRPVTEGSYIVVSVYETNTAHYSFDPDLPKDKWPGERQLIKVYPPRNCTVYAYASMPPYRDSEIVSQAVEVCPHAPVFSIAGGSFTEPQTFTITSESSGCVIYYTLDGTAPTHSSSMIENGGSVTVSSTATVRAVAAKDGFTDSAVISHDFMFDGSGAITVTPPDPYLDVKITVPDGMSGMNFVPGVKMTLHPSVSADDVTWYFDGTPAKSPDGSDISKGSILALGTLPNANLKVQEGYHAVTLVASAGGVEYSDTIYFTVAAGGAGEAGKNFEASGMSTLSGRVENATLTKSASPYYVLGDTELVTSTVEPGTEFLVTGPYTIITKKTSLKGTASDRIVFRGIDTGTDTWVYDGTTSLSYVDILASGKSLENSFLFIDHTRIETSPGTRIGQDSMSIHHEISDSYIRANLYSPSYGQFKNVTVEGNADIYSGTIAENLTVTGRLFITESDLKGGVISGESIFHDTTVQNVDFSGNITFERSVITYSTFRNCTVSSIYDTISWSEFLAGANVSKTQGYLEHCNILTDGKFSIRKPAKIGGNYWGETRTAELERIKVSDSNFSFLGWTPSAIGTWELTAIAGIGYQGEGEVVPADTSAMTFKQGDVGPGGGIIFSIYRDEYFEYLPISYGMTPDCIFGCYRNSPDGADLEVGTYSSMGSGKSNTEELILAMEGHAYDGSGKPVTVYAAKAVHDFTFAGKTDWYLPSSDEVSAMPLTSDQKLSGCVFSTVATSTESGASKFVVSDGTNFKRQGANILPVRSWR